MRMIIGEMKSDRSFGTVCRLQQRRSPTFRKKNVPPDGFKVDRWGELFFVLQNQGQGMEVVDLNNQQWNVRGAERRENVTLHHGCNVSEDLHH
jgi:hypothetical protein